MKEENKASQPLMDGGKSWIWMSLVLLIQIELIWWDQNNIEMCWCTAYTAYHVRPASEMNDP